MTVNALTREHVLDLLENVKDPEIPVINVLELGVVRTVVVEPNGKAIITITPTYTGCPAMDVMAADIKKELLDVGVPEVEVKLTLSPAWSTDQITDEGKRKLKEYGIAPPEKTADIRALKGAVPVVECPCAKCGHVLSTAARPLGAGCLEPFDQFGCTACKALWKCPDCATSPFDQRFNPEALIGVCATRTIVPRSLRIVLEPDVS
ncbi:MAG: phenylacetate-CoA oxygenase subunit PaaJ [Flavobacteriales bacterium]|nr:phenylacetate-CoA oxygenase subunit PaaJ [Flavobacteriales bacterium]